MSDDDDSDIISVEDGSVKSLANYEDSAQAVQLSYCVDMLGIIARELRMIRMMKMQRNKS